MGFTVFPFSIYLIVSKIQEIVHNKDNAEKERWECRNRQKELDSFESKLKKDEERLYLRSLHYDRLDLELKTRQECEEQIADLQEKVKKQERTIEQLQQSSSSPPRPIISISQSELLARQRRAFSEEKAEFEKKQKEAQKLHKQALDNLNFVFFNTYNVSQNLERVVDGRLLNAFDSNLSFLHFDVDSLIRSIHTDGTEKNYSVTLTQCNCDDFKASQRPCKHMLFLAYHVGALQINRVECERYYDISVEKINKNAKRIKAQKAKLKQIEKAAAKAAAKNESLKS